MSFPPRFLKAERSGLTALTIEPTFSSTTFRSRSRSKVRQSQSRLPYATWNDPTEIAGGTSKGAIAVQVVSLPSSLPGKTYCPAFVFAGAYMRFTDSIWGAVRHLSDGTPLHSKTAGSNLHIRGSLSRPSLTPSLASHASMTALFSSVAFAV